MWWDLFFAERMRKFEGNKAIQFALTQIYPNLVCDDIFQTAPFFFHPQIKRIN